MGKILNKARNPFRVLEKNKDILQLFLVNFDV
jgi:hypothetical protein